MLETQQRLRAGGSLDDLAIKVTKHPELPLAIYNYDQIVSRPKTHPIVRECRGLVLHSETHDLVARAFPRFFNWGELADELDQFNWSDCVAHDKEDGSLCILYNFNGQWHANTRGSFALDQMQFQSLTWRQGFCAAMGVQSLRDLDGVLDLSLTYVCEFVSPWNKVVRAYSEPRMYLLTAFRGTEELSHHETELLAGPFIKPQKYTFNHIDQVTEWITELANTDKTYEGVVLRDSGNRRWKVKSPTYLALHRMGGENVYNPKNLLPFILSGEGDELLTYYPEVTKVYNALKNRVTGWYAVLEDLWLETKDIVSQKDFALAIKDRTPFTGVLFQTRKSQGDLATVWQRSHDIILNKITQ